MDEKVLMDDKILEIYSKMNPAILLAVLYRPFEVTQRVNITKNTSILQAGVIPLSVGFTVSPHRHHPTPRETVGTDEAWVVASGSIRVDIFDLDEVLLNSWILNQGSLVINANGGHGLTSLQSGTIVYEFKNGPYWGQDVDRIQIKH